MVKPTPTQPRRSASPTVAVTAWSPMLPPVSDLVVHMRPLLLTLFPLLTFIELLLMPAVAYVGTVLGAGRRLFRRALFPFGL